MTNTTTNLASLPDGQTLVRRPFRSPLYSGNARTVFERGMRSQWQGNLGVMVSGFLEPVLFLLAMGLGLGALIGTITDDAGRVSTIPPTSLPLCSRRRP